jgi:hypothetical protein
MKELMGLMYESPTMRTELQALANSALIKDFHKQTDLTFKVFTGNLDNISTKLKIHHSPTGYGKAGGSRYYLVFNKDKYYYIRVSNHWGHFTTRDTGWHNWQLEGGQKRKDGEYPNTFQAGYIELNP